jgi:hypothetical protein
MAVLSSEIVPKDVPVSQEWFLPTMKCIEYRIFENFSESNFSQQFCEFVAVQYPVNIIR